jgi:hypothetical protein
MSHTTSILCVIFAAGCTAPPAEMLAPPEPDQGFQLAMDVDAEPGEETWKCQILTLDVQDLQNVNRVKHVQSNAVHHMDVMVILNSGMNKPPGTYDCGPLYEQFPKLMEETILYASQIANDEIQLPPGVVAKVPGGLTLMFELHNVNATANKVHLSSRINAYTIPANEAKASIWGAAVRDRNLNLAPGADVTEWSRCVVDEDVDVLFLSSHMHELGRDAEILRFDGKSTGQMVYRNDDWASPKLLSFGTQPLKLRKGEGFEFRCHYTNTRAVPVNWGFNAKDEMCNMAWVYTPGDSKVKCQVVETSDGQIVE